MSGAFESDDVEPYVSKVDRRAALAWLGAAAATVTAPEAGFAATPAASPAKGYGTDPNLMHPTAPWPRLMSRTQLQTAAVLCDFILPASADAPSANALGVPDFIDEWISAPYPDQLADRPVILKGLDWADGEARRRSGKALFEIAPAERAALLTPLTRKPTDEAMQTPHRFFRRFRSLTIGAYYTTKPGFKDIGYIGNVGRPSDPGPSPEVKAAVDAALKKLGL